MSQSQAQTVSNHIDNLLDDSSCFMSANITGRSRIQLWSRGIMFDLHHPEGGGIHLSLICPFSSLLDSDLY